MSYTLQGDGIGVEVALPFSEAEVAALEAFLSLSPQERMAALVKLNADDFLSSLRADYPGLAERMHRGPGVKTKIPPGKSGIKELDEIMDKMLDLVGADGAAGIAECIEEILKR